MRIASACGILGSERQQRAAHEVSGVTRRPLISCAALFVAFLFLAAAPDSALAQEKEKEKPKPAAASPKEERYSWKGEHDPNGIGKFYKEREIAHVMGHAAAGWLERKEREEEEQPAKLLKALKLEEGMVVADIGAGSGYYSFRMSKLVGAKGKILAVDIQKEMLDMIRERSKKEGITNVEPVEGAEQDPKLAANSVDLILLVDVYHEFDHPYEMTEKMVAALKPGGRLVFVEFRKEDSNVPIKEVHKMSQKQVLREMADFADLKYDSTSDVLPWQHIIFFRKVKK